MEEKIKKEYIVLHERVALAYFNSEKKAHKFIIKLSKEKHWISNNGIYKIVEIKRRYHII